MTPVSLLHLPHHDGSPLYVSDEAPALGDTVTVPAGTVVTTGTWCGMLRAAAGQRVTVAFAGFDSATVRL